MISELWCLGFYEKLPEPVRDFFPLSSSRFFNLSCTIRCPQNENTIPSITISMLNDTDGIFIPAPPAPVSPLHLSILLLFLGNFRNPW